MSLQTNHRYIVATAIFGILLSTYALYVEMSADAHPEYKALCDISEHASCSRVLTSKFAKGFGILPVSWSVPNCIIGIMFYCLMIFLSTYNSLKVVRIQLGLAVLSLLTCIYLAYLLIFVLKDFCIVCVSTYFCNFYLAYLLLKKMQIICCKRK